jgi:hypothetical protein
VVSLFLKDFHRKSKPWSRLFKAGNNKILECMNGLKSRFFEKIDFFIFLKKLPKTIYFANLAKNSKNRPKILVCVKISHYNFHPIERYSKNEFFQVAHLKSFSVAK